MRAVLLLAPCLLALGCNARDNAERDRSDAESQAPAVATVRFAPDVLARLGVRSEPLGEADAHPRLKLPGTVEYVLDRYAEVGTVVEGRVTQVHVRVGDRVRRGQALATLLVPAVATSQAELLTTQAALKSAREQARRETALFEKQLTTAREEELAQSSLGRAEAEYAAARAKLRLLGVDEPETQSAIRADGTVQLTAPLAGVVVQRDAVLGGHLLPNEIAFVVADPSVVWVTVDVHEVDLPYVHLGTPVEFSVDALPGRTFTGRIDLIDPHVGTASRVLRARIVVPNAEGALRPGTFARVLVPMSSGDEGLFVRRSAVQPLAGRDVVFVERSAGEFEVRTVQVARRTSQLAEISGGVAPGERLVIEGAFLLRAEVTKQ